jgi:hypothetical protein
LTNTYERRVLVFARVFSSQAGRFLEQLYHIARASRGKYLARSRSLTKRAILNRGAAVTVAEAKLAQAHADPFANRMISDQVAGVLV